MNIKKEEIIHFCKINYSDLILNTYLRGLTPIFMCRWNKGIIFIFAVGVLITNQLFAQLPQYYVNHQMHRN